MPGKTDARKVKRLDSIKQAIMLEIHGLRFYQVAAERCTSQGARELFSDLAEDEVRHRTELERQFRSILRTGGWSPPPADEHHDLKFKDPVIGASLKKDIDGAWFDSAALHIGVMLEKRAMEHYQEQAQATKEAKVKSLFEWLADWEKGHLQRLMAMEKSMREEIWNEARFWPMD